MSDRATWTTPNPPGEAISGEVIATDGEWAWFRFTHRDGGAEHRETVRLSELSIAGLPPGAVCPSPPDKCSACGAPQGEGEPLYFCDEATGGPWCGTCFPTTACGRGEHGEGCATAMFGIGLKDAVHG